MRQAFITSLCAIAKRDKRIFLLTGDLGYRVLEPFRDQFPDRFINVGVAEANLITVACGLSSVGFVPFVYSIATFLTMRPFEQIRNYVALQNSNVKLVGVGAGLAYTKAGPTHHAMEDIALMRTLPNMTIIAPKDQKDVTQVVRAVVHHKGPSYIRIERNPDFESEVKSSFQIGKGQQYQKGQDVAIIVTGTKLGFAMSVSGLLQKQGHKSSVYHFPTIQPLDTTLVGTIAKKNAIIVTIEEHRVDGGLGSAVSEYIAGIPIKTKPRVLRFGLKNEFTKISADYQTLCRDHRFTPDVIAKTIITAM